MHTHQLLLILGQNGAGKSTLLCLLAGLEKPTAGAVFLDGEHIQPKKITPRAAVVMQFPADFFIARTVFQELTFGRGKYFTPDRVRETLDEVRLRDISLLVHPRKLSGGQQRKLVIAVQMLKDPQPRFMLMDEPLVGVDFGTRRVIMEMMERFKSEGQAIVVVTHEPGEMLRIADRVVQIANGEILEVPRSVVDKALAIRKEKGLHEYQRPLNHMKETV